MARKQYDLLVGLFALGAIVVLAYMIIQFGGGGWKSRDTIDIVVEFNQAAGLIKDAPVYLSGVEIGGVTDLEVTDAGKVHVKMKVVRKAGLRTGDKPEIVQTGVLGDVIVNFIRGETPGEIARSGTVFVGRDAVNIMKEAEEAMAALRRVIDLLSTKETTGTLKGILENIEALTGEENRALLRTSLQNLSALTTELRQDLESVRQVFTPEFGADVRAIVANAHAASEDLPELTREGTLILRETRTHLIQLAENLSKNAEHFNSILAAVDEILATTARGEGTVGRLVKDPAMYDSTVDMLNAVRDTVIGIKYYGPIWGTRIREAEAEKAAEEARASMIWRR